MPYVSSATRGYTGSNRRGSPVGTSDHVTMSITRYRSDDSRRNPLKGKTCLVTGASRGIGREIALEFARSGADVAINYRSSADAAAETTESIEEMGGTVTAVQSDVSDLERVEHMAAEVREDIGPIDVLVNNAGVTADSKFEHMSKAEWDQVIDVNLGGTFNCTKTFFEDIRRSPQGRVINISSVVGQAGNFGQANYAASKSGIFGLTRTVAIELAGSGSTANCVAPGFTETAMLDGVPERVRAIILERIPMNRFAAPEDIVGMVRFIASDESRYMTGQIIGINGGMEW